MGLMAQEGLYVTFYVNSLPLPRSKVRWTAANYVGTRPACFSTVMCNHGCLAFYSLNVN